MYNAIDPTAIKFYRGVYNTGGRSSGYILKITDGNGWTDFESPFKLPETPELPSILIRGYSSGGVTDGKLPPNVYVNPILSITAGSFVAEVGSRVNLEVEPYWEQNDAGDATRYELYQNNTRIYSNTTPVAHTISNLLMTDAGYEMYGKVFYNDGPIKEGADGEQVLAGSINSDIISVVGYRAAFALVSNVHVVTPTTSAGVRGLPSVFNNVASTKQLVLDVPSGTIDVIFAVPTSIGNTIDVNIGPISYLNDFIRSFVNVEGANGYAAISYIVYHQHSDTGILPGRYVITITD